MKNTNYEKSTNMTEKADERYSGNHQSLALIESVIFSKEAAEEQYNYYKHGILPKDRNQLEEIERLVSNINFHFIGTIWQCCKSEFEKNSYKPLNLDKNTKCNHCNQYLICNPGYVSAIGYNVYCGHYQSSNPTCASTAITKINLTNSYAYILPFFLFVRLEDVIERNNNSLNSKRKYLSCLYSYYEPIFYEKLKCITTELKFYTRGTAKYGQIEYNRNEIQESLPKLIIYLKNLYILYFCKESLHNITLPDSAISNLRKLEIAQLSDLINTQNIENLKKLIIIINSATDEEIEKVNKDKIHENYWNDLLKDNNISSDIPDTFPTNRSPIDSLSLSISINSENNPLSHLIQEIFPILAYKELSIDKSCLIISGLKTKNGNLHKNLSTFLNQHITDIQTSTKEELEIMIVNFIPELENFRYIKNPHNKNIEKSASENSDSFLENFSKKNTKKREIIHLGRKSTLSQKKPKSTERKFFNTTLQESIITPEQPTEKPHSRKNIFATPKPLSKKTERAKTEYRDTEKKETTKYQEYSTPNDLINYENYFNPIQWSILTNEFGKSGTNGDASINTNTFLNENQNFTKRILELVDLIANSKKKPVEFTLFVINERNNFPTINQTIPRPQSTKPYTPRDETRNIHYYDAPYNQKYLTNTQPYSDRYQEQNTSQSNEHTILVQREAPSRIDQIGRPFLSESITNELNTSETPNALEISMYNQQKLNDLGSDVESLKNRITAIEDSYSRIEEFRNQTRGPNQGFTSFLRDTIGPRKIGSIKKNV